MPEGPHTRRLTEGKRDNAAHRHPLISLCCLCVCLSSVSGGLFGISIGDPIITGTYDLSGMHCYVDPNTIKDMIKAMTMANIVYKGDL